MTGLITKELYNVAKQKNDIKIVFLHKFANIRFFANISFLIITITIGNRALR